VPRTYRKYGAVVAVSSLSYACAGSRGGRSYYSPYLPKGLGRRSRNTSLVVVEMYPEERLRVATIPISVSSMFVHLRDMMIFLWAKRYAPMSLVCPLWNCSILGGCVNEGLER